MTAQISACRFKPSLTSVCEEYSPLFQPVSDVIASINVRSEEHTSELQSRFDLVCRLLLEKKNKSSHPLSSSFVFTALPTSDIYTLSLHDALPISLNIFHFSCL